MTRFSPESNNLDPQQWSELACRRLQENNDQYSLFACLGVAACVSAAASPISGLLVAGWAFSHHISKGKKRQDNINAIIDTGCIAHTLSGVDFKRYLNQVGHDATKAELEYAHDHNLEFSDDALDYFEGEPEPFQIPQVLALPNAIASIKNRLMPSAIESQSENYTNPDSQINIISSMTDRISNSFILGVAGTGKGMLVANALREAKSKHPKLKIFYIDPKADKKESGYIDGVADIIKRYQCETESPETVVKWLTKCFAEFNQYANTTHVNGGRTLLVLDEGTVLGLKCKLAKSSLILDRLSSLTSQGDSTGKNIWFVAQTPFVGGSGIDLSASSQLVIIALVSAENRSSLEQWKRSAMLKKLDNLDELIESSEVNRAVFFGKTAKWYPMPRLENYSRYDRDNDKYLSDSNSETESEPMQDTTTIIKNLEATFNKKDDDIPLSELAKRLLSFFENAKNKDPKTLSDIKKKDELREQGDVKLITALSELVTASELIFNGEDSWSKFDW
ncbi:MAG: hypothetical protein KME22_06610 [Hassallia sp. WJT32-NPBG1]|jgi:Cdc6-like AAA superfamily ATPase|nr:hypothetical protein [Hassallia sp. WJT32-NPBG1]